MNKREKERLVNVCTTSTDFLPTDWTTHGRSLKNVKTIRFLSTTAPPLERLIVVTHLHCATKLGQKATVRFSFLSFYLSLILLPLSHIAPPPNSLSSPASILHPTHTIKYMSNIYIPLPRSSRRVPLTITPHTSHTHSPPHYTTDHNLHALTCTPATAPTDLRFFLKIFSLTHSQFYQFHTSYPPSAKRVQPVHPSIHLSIHRLSTNNHRSN